jgi:hypothetical protein
MPPMGFKPATPASDVQQSLALDLSATGIGKPTEQFRPTSYLDIGI